MRAASAPTLSDGAIPVVVHGNAAHSGSSLAAAMQNNTLGVGWSGSGYLVFYFTGVTAVLKHLGVLSNTTRLAGSSGGAANAAATCAGVDPLEQYRFLSQMAEHCRPSGGCRGFLDSVVTQRLHTLLPSDAPKRCSGRLYTAVTAARPDGEPDTHMLLGSHWSDKDQLVSAVSASCYLPAVSGPTATTKLWWKPDAGAVYDGGFSHRLPCPPGVERCIKVAAQAPVPGLQPGQDLAAFIDMLNAGLMNSTTCQATTEEDDHTAPYLPLNPDIVNPTSVDIYPGLAGELLVPPQVWNSYGLEIPDDATLQFIYDTGRRDAAHWVSLQQILPTADIIHALHATSVAS